jgi:hypothetical protein
MREIILKYYQGQPITIDECIMIMEKYMKKINKYNPTLIESLLNPMNPFGQAMIEHAVGVSARSLSDEYNIVRLFNKEGQLVKVY